MVLPRLASRRVVERDAFGVAGKVGHLLEFDALGIRKRVARSAARRREGGKERRTRQASQRASANGISCRQLLS